MNCLNCQRSSQIQCKDNNRALPFFSFNKMWVCLLLRTSLSAADRIDFCVKFCTSLDLIFNLWKLEAKALVYDCSYPQFIIGKIHCKHSSSPVFLTWSPLCDNLPDQISWQNKLFKAASLNMSDFHQGLMSHLIQLRQSIKKSAPELSNESDGNMCNLELYYNDWHVKQIFNLKLVKQIFLLIYSNDLDQQKKTWKHSGSNALFPRLLAVSRYLISS